MFFFGSPDDSAELLYQEAKSSGGPGVSDSPIEDLGEEDLRIAFTYLYQAVVLSRRNELPEDVQEALLARYDAAFVLMVERSERFKAALKENRHVWATGYSKESVAKYKKLAGIFSSAS